MTSLDKENQLRTIRLYGKLGTQFGRVHRIAVGSTREAMQFMCSMIPGFERELMTSKDRGIAYACFIGKKNISEEQLSFPAGEEDIRIAPILQGSKRGGMLQVILGAVLIVVGLAINYITMGTGGNQIIMLGAAMMFGGVVQMLSPQQKGLAAKDSPNNGASYNFNGPVNTTAQGNPVPIGYGEMLIGSAVISAGIYNEDQI